MYDITNENSFKGIRTWHKKIEANANPDTCKVLVGNNCDLPDRKVTEEEGRQLGNELNMHFFETSPKTNQNISEVFNYLVGEILKINGEKESNYCEII